MDPIDPAPETPAEIPAPDATPDAARAPEPAEAAPVEATSTDAAGAPPEETLAQLVEKAQLGRLTPAEEERAAWAIKELLLAGKSGVATVAAALPKLAWMVGVSGVTAAWPEMKATPKGQLLKALADDETDAARRFRLSLARGLHKLQDVATTLKIAVGVAKEMREKETGEIALRNAQMFANVFIGKAKPWCALLPLADLKNSEADALVHCAVVAAFTLQHPPVTQLGVIKWAAEAGRLADLDATALGALTKGVARWPGKWHNILRNEVAELPAAILEVLKPAEAATAESAEPEPGNGANTDADSESEPNGEDGAPKPKERPVYISKTIPPKEGREAQEPRDRRDPRAPQAGSGRARARGFAEIAGVQRGRGAAADRRARRLAQRRTQERGDQSAPARRRPPPFTPAQARGDGNRR